jgi:hypothetical protein
MIRYQLNQWQPEAGSFGPRGSFTFDGAITAQNGGAAPNQFNAYAAFLLGLDQSAGKTLQNIKMTGREWQFGWYARDRWQATRKLTLNFGLRYELYPLVQRSHTGLGRFDLNTNQILIGGVGSNDENAGVTISRKMFAPRLGVPIGSTTQPLSGWAMESAMIRCLCRGYSAILIRSPFLRVFPGQTPLPRSLLFRQAFRPCQSPTFLQVPLLCPPAPSSAEALSRDCCIAVISSRIISQSKGSSRPPSW